jgi:hypothetical protein
MIYRGEFRWPLFRMEADKTGQRSDIDTVQAFYRYMPREKLDDLETERVRLRKTQSKSQASLDDAVLSVLFKKGPLFLQYRKTIPIRLDQIDDTFHFVNCRVV